MERVICLLIGYVCGLFQTSYFIGKFYKKDIRNYGSGNAGTTNALRVLGRKAAVATLLCDALKCILAIVVVKGIFTAASGEILALLCMYAAFGTILGHNFPFYMGFRGGKGFAASVGFAIAFDFSIFAIGIVLFFAIFFATHYVSLGTMVVYVYAFVHILIAGQSGNYNMTQGHLIELYCVMGVMTALTIFRHRQNIVRLLNGTENKTFLSKKEKKE